MSHSRMKHPVMVLPQAMQAMLALGKAAEVDQHACDVDLRFDEVGPQRGGQVRG